MNDEYGKAKRDACLSPVHFVMFSDTNFSNAQSNSVFNAANVHVPG
jgi:hypothetical protein